MSKKGFTLVEIMIVVAIIGLLVAIAVPAFMKNRRDAQGNACAAQLDQIYSAKEQIAFKLNLRNSAQGWPGTSAADAVDTYLRGFSLANSLTACPTAGTYALGGSVVNDDGAVNFLDLGEMKADFLATDPDALLDADLDGDGAVNFVDLGILKAGFLAPPGPGNGGLVTDPVPEQPNVNTTMRVLAANDLGMHCMNRDHHTLSILPPFNTLNAQVILRGDASSPPQIVHEGLTMEYSIPGNTYSAGKTDFWDHVLDLFGVDLPPDVGLTGKTMADLFDVHGDQFIAEGIPITPFTDAEPTVEDPYQQAEVILRDASGLELARARPADQPWPEEALALPGTAAGASPATSSRSKSVPAPRAEPSGPREVAIREALTAWRRERSKADGVPAYVVLDNKTLDAIARAEPRSLIELGAVNGIGPAKLERYGSDVLGLVASVDDS